MGEKAAFELPEMGSATWRAIAILEWVAQAQRPVVVAEIVHHLALPKPSAHRLCASLERMGLLRRDPGGAGLLVGQRLLSLSLDTVMNFADSGARRAILKSLMQETGETCTLTVPDRDELIVLERVESTSPLMVQLRPGSRAPLHCTASGKLFLSMLAPAYRRKLLENLPLKACTGHTITDPDLLDAHLDSVRKNRYATDDEEFVTGLTALAVPVCDRRGRIRAAISINAPAARLSIREAVRRVPMLRRAADAMARAIAPDQGV